MNETNGGINPESSADEVTGDDYRSRTGIVLLVLGVLLLLWAWGSFVYRTSDASPEETPTNVQAGPGFIENEDHTTD